MIFQTSMIMFHVNLQFQVMLLLYIYLSIYIYILSASGFGLRGTWKISSIGQVVLYRRGYYPLWLLNELDCFSFDGEVTGNWIARCEVREGWVNFNFSPLMFFVAREWVLKELCVLNFEHTISIAMVLFKSLCLSFMFLIFCNVTWS